MKEPASTRPPPAPGANGADADRRNLEELRRLLISKEQERIGGLENRLDNPEIRAEEVGRVLSNTKIRKSLEQLLRSILKRDADLVAEAVRPVILQSVRKAVTDALRELTESLNQMAEKSVSPRALKWRFEAWRTGKKFSDIVLSRSLLYSVREVFLIHGKTGVLLQQATKQAVTKDADMISSMLTAIQDFVRDSFAGTEDKELETVDLGTFKLWIQHGPRAIIAGAVSGAPPVELKGVFRAALDEIEENFAADLSSFQGDVSPFESTRPILERCLLGESGPKPRRSLIPWWLVAAFILLIAGLIAWAAIAIRDHQRWQNYIQILSAEPGIVITHVDKQGSGYIVTGLCDELACDPATLQNNLGAPPVPVEFHLDPYQSLSPQFTATRSFNAEKATLERSVIRFAPGKSDLSPAEQDNLDQIAAHIQSLMNAASTLHKTVRIDVIGHTDHLGTEEGNARLSQDRADQVTAALVSAGIGRPVLTSRGIATSGPVRSGLSDRDRSFNRSVTLRIIVT